MKSRLLSASARREATSMPLADQFSRFLAACCDLDPRAWSRSSELWQVYVGWGENQQLPLMLSRRAFANHLKAQGCRAGRTNTVRLWLGIAMVKKAP